MEGLPHLESFIALARAGSLAEAARALGVPRSTVSRRLAALEEALGEQLLIRNTRGVLLTDAGRLLLERGAPLLAGLRALHEDIGQMRGAARGVLRISAPPGLGSEFLGEFLQHLRVRLPEVELDVLIRDGIPHLLEEDIDVAFCESPLEDVPWYVHKIGPAARIAVAGPGYLARRGTPRAPEDLDRHDCLGLRSGHDRPTEWPLQGGGAVAIRPVLRSNDMQLLRKAAISDLGIALLPAYVVLVDLLEGVLVSVLPRLGREASLLALTARKRSESARLDAFFGAVQDFVARQEARAAPPDARL